MHGRGRDGGDVRECSDAAYLNIKRSFQNELRAVVKIKNTIESIYVFLKNDF